MCRTSRISCWVAFSALGLAGCQGPGPTPADYASRELPAVEADADREVLVEQGIAAARSALQQGDHRAAARRAEEAIARDPRAAVARALLGAALARVGGSDPVALPDLERAEGELLLARRLDPSNGEIQLLFARFLERDGHLTRAAAELDDLLAAHPQDRAALALAGRLRFELGQERAARPLLRELLSLDPKNAEAAYRLAHCELRLAEAVARKDTPNEPPKGAGAEAYLRAAAAFRTYQKLAPQDSAGLLGEAHARFLAAGQSETPDPAELRGILARLDAATALDPRGAAAHHSRGVVLESLGETAAARSAYRAALERDPKFVASILNLGRLLDAAGETEEAKSVLRKAVRLSTDAAERKELGRYLTVPK